MNIGEVIVMYRTAMNTRDENHAKTIVNNNAMGAYRTMSLQIFRSFEQNRRGKSA
jgi:hypothetical protein